MNEEVKSYFDALASKWDSFGGPKEAFVTSLIASLPIKESDVILDLACGTGVLTKALLNSPAKHIIGLDISAEMIRLAKSKFEDPRVEFIQGDFYQFNLAVDHIICFNAYPHFLDRKGFARIAASSIKDGGILCIVHDSGRKQLDAHHDAHAKGVSRHLLSAEEESKVFQNDFEVLEIIDNESEYKIVLKRRPH